MEATTLTLVPSKEKVRLLGVIAFFIPTSYLAASRPHAERRQFWVRIMEALPFACMASELLPHLIGTLAADRVVTNECRKEWKLLVDT